MVLGVLEQRLPLEADVLSYGSNKPSLCLACWDHLLGILMEIKAKEDGKMMGLGGKFFSAMDSFCSLLYSILHKCYTEGDVTFGFPWNI